MSNRQRRRSFPSRWPKFLDASTTYPTKYDPAVIEQARILTIPKTLSTYTGPSTTSSDSYVSHSLVYASLGLTDNIEININWRIRQVLGFVCQVAPCGGVNMAAAPMEMGFKPVQDISLPAQYMQNMFRSETISDCLDPAYYDAYAEGVDFSTPFADFCYESQWVTLRCVDGFMQGYFNGVPVAELPMERPAHTIGIDGWGIDFIGIHFTEPVSIPTGGVSDARPLVEVSEFIWNPYDGEL